MTNQNLWWINKAGQINPTFSYYTGSLISNRYVVTAAENFDDEYTEVDFFKKSPRYWKALPGVFDVDNIASYQTSQWKDISKIDIHPLYKGNVERWENIFINFSFLPSKITSFYL